MATQKLILAFVTLILGIALLSTISTQSIAVSELIPISNESVDVSSALSTTGVNTSKVFTITNAPTGWEQEDCPISSFVLKNSSGTTFTLTTDYTFNASTGTFALKNTSTVNNSYATDNLTDAFYSYCGEGYMNISWGRTILNIVPGLFAIALLGVSIALFYSIAKDYGII